MFGAGPTGQDGLPPAEVYVVRRDVAKGLVTPTAPVTASCVTTGVARESRRGSIHAARMAAGVQAPPATQCGQLTGPAASTVATLASPMVGRFAPPSDPTSKSTSTHFAVGLGRRSGKRSNHRASINLDPSSGRRLCGARLRFCYRSLHSQETARAEILDEVCPTQSLRSDITSCQPS